MQNLWLRNHACTVSPTESTKIGLIREWRGRYSRKFQMERQLCGVHCYWFNPNPSLQMWRMKSYSHMIRASIGMRIPNQAMKRSWCVQSPRVEDFIYRLHDCKIIMKLDLRQGYHQLPLDPSTRQVATFSTPCGKLQTPTTGVRSKILTRCLWQGHVQNLWRQSTEKYQRPYYSKREITGSHLTERNCQFGKEQIEFFGHVFTKDGLKPSSDKVRAVKSTWEQRGCAKLSWDGRVLKQLHQELCNYINTAIPADKERNKISLG